MLLKFLLSIGLILILLVWKTLIKLSITKKRVNREIAEYKVEKIDNPGTIQELKILPLVEYYSENDQLKTEAGVSYWITAGDTNLILDVGANGRKEHPSPLLHNMKSLGKNLNDVDFLFLSHPHLDHIGGMKEQKDRTFSLSHGSVSLPPMPVYSPVEMTPSEFNPSPDVQVIPDPVVIRDGIISIGSIPRALYLMGYTLENSLAFNVDGKGIVIVIGCGHQTIERIIERVHELFAEPIYGIIGGLHLPAGDGRIKIGPLDIQAIVGTDRFPWKALGRKDTEDAINAIKKVDPGFIALSPHDSSDWTLNRFRDEFGDKYHDLKVGKEIVI